MKMLVQEPPYTGNFQNRSTFVTVNQLPVSAIVMLLLADITSILALLVVLGVSEEREEVMQHET